MRQRGAVLIVALALMVILALLASTGMRLSLAEMVMAGNEQYRHAASMASSSGIEAAVAQIGQRGAPSPGETLAGEGYVATIRYAGDETNLTGSSVGRLVGHHYEVTSIGTSARQARDEQVQGVMVISDAPTGVATFRRIGEGLASEMTP